MPRTSISYVEPGVDLHGRSHLPVVSGSHWSEAHLRAFKVQYDFHSGSIRDENLPGLRDVVERLRETLSPPDRRKLKKEPVGPDAVPNIYESLMTFANQGRRGTIAAHPMDILRSVPIGAQFYHDLSVATAPPTYVIDEEDSELPREDEGGAERRVQPLRATIQRNPLYQDFSGLPGDIEQNLSSDPLVGLTPHQFGRTVIPSSSAYLPSSSFNHPTPGDFDLVPNIQPETTSRALAKSFIETVLVLRPAADRTWASEQDNNHDDVDELRLSFHIGEKTFRLALPAVRCTIINDGGVVYSRSTPGPIPSSRVFLSLETKAKDLQTDFNSRARKNSSNAQGTLKGATEILAQQCAELIGQALSDPGLKNIDEAKAYYLVSMSGYNMSFLSATFTPEYVQYLHSSCEKCSESEKLRELNLENRYSNRTTPDPSSSQGEQSPGTSPIQPIPSVVKRSRSVLTDDSTEDNSERNIRERDTSAGDVEDYTGVSLNVERSKDFDLTEATGRVGAIAHLLAIFDIIEKESGCRF